MTGTQERYLISTSNECLIFLYLVLLQMRMFACGLYFLNDFLILCWNGQREHSQCGCTELK